MAKKSEGAAKTVTVEQTGSPIRRPADQRATLIGLGLNRIRRRSTTPTSADCSRTSRCARAVGNASAGVFLGTSSDSSMRHSALAAL